MAKLRKVLDSLASVREAASKLLELWQNSRSVADYVVDFCTLAAESAWNLESLFATFLHRLSEVVTEELAAQELPMDLDSLITLIIRIDGHLMDHRIARRSGLRHTCTRNGVFTSRSNSEVSEGSFSERIRSHSSPLVNLRGVSWTLLSLCSWEELGYQLASAHGG